MTGIEKEGRKMKGKRQKEEGYEGKEEEIEEI